jgi:hypothetical protein
MRKLANLPADIQTALTEYDAKVANGTLPVIKSVAVIPGPTHPEVFLAGNALSYFMATGAVGR